MSEHEETVIIILVLLAFVVIPIIAFIKSMRK